MKDLSRKDTRGLGYFTVGTAILCLAMDAGLDWELGWLGLSIACLGMLGVVFIAEGSDPAFARANRVLYGIVGMGFVLPPLVITLSRLWAGRITISIEPVASLALVVFSVGIFAWYVRRHGVERDCSEPDEGSAEDDPEAKA